MPDRSGPRTVKAIQGIACAGHIHKLSHGQAFALAVARPLFRLYRDCWYIAIGLFDPTT